MAKVVENAFEFRVGGLSEDFFQDPIEVAVGFLFGGLKGGEIRQVAGLVTIQRRMELEQDETIATDEADREPGTVCAGVETPPDQFRQLVAAKEHGHGVVEPVRGQIQFPRHPSDGFLERPGEWVGARVSAIQSDHIHVVSVAGGDFLSQQCTPARDDERNGNTGFLK